MATIQVRRDTSANWTSTNPVLANGEPGLETDTMKMKHGDGSTEWNGLDYSSEPLTEASSPIVVDNDGLVEILTDRDLEESTDNWRPIYRKVLDCGSLLNASTKQIAHGVTNFNKMWIADSLFDNGTDSFALPFAHPTAYVNGYQNGTNIDIATGTNRTSYSGWVVLEYTKTTDTATSEPRKTQAGGLGGDATNILYDTGVITGVQQTITIPDSVTTGKTQLRIEIDGVYGNGASSYSSCQLFVNSDTTTTNYATRYLTNSGSGATSGSSSTTDLGGILKNQRSMIIANVSVVNGQMMFQSEVNRDVATASTAPDYITRVGKYHANTITDLTGMSIVSTESLAFDAGSRIRIIDPHIAGGGGSTTQADVNDQTGDDYTLTTDDPGKTIDMDNSAPNTIYIPLNATEAITTTSIMKAMQKGVGNTGIKAVSGVTLNGTDGGHYLIDAQYGGVDLRKLSTDSWRIGGDITDAPAETSFTLNGSATISTTIKKFGAGSLSAINAGTGTGTDYANFGSSIDNIGAQQFSMGCWLRAPVTTGTVFFPLINRRGLSSQIGFSFSFFNGTLTFGYSTNGSTFAVSYSETWSPTADTWYHVEVNRDDSKIYLFVDGTMLGTGLTDSGTIFSSTQPVRVGSDSFNNCDQSYIDDVFIDIGAARHTSNFTAPTKEFIPNINTVAWTNFNETP